MQRTTWLGLSAGVRVRVRVRVRVKVRGAAGDLGLGLVCQVRGPLEDDLVVDLVSMIR
jgi:hypothetical protein